MSYHSQSEPQVFLELKLVLWLVASGVEVALHGWRQDYNFWLPSKVLAISHQTRAAERWNRKV